MKSLELAKQMLEEAGYKVTPPEEKFTPYKGQLVEDLVGRIYQYQYTYNIDANNLTHFDEFGLTHSECRPLSNKYIKQFKPWSERGDYNGPANVLFESGETGVFDAMDIAEQPHNISNFSGKPIAFEPLEK